MTTVETPSGVDLPAAKKRWVPLENNPALLTPLAHTLGLPPHLSFHDIHTLTSPADLAFLPRPALALLLLFPGSPTYLAFREAQEAALPEQYPGKGDGEPVVWFKQTIGNACGSIGVLHCIANAGAEPVEGSFLEKLKKDAVPLEMEGRARWLYDNAEFEAAHQVAAGGGDSNVPPASVKLNEHYVAFVRGKDGYLYELDGGRRGPTRKGKLEDGEDMLSPRVLEMGVLKYFEREEGAGGDVRFAVTCLAPGLD